jgi:hypothetical protein
MVSIKREFGCKIILLELENILSLIVFLEKQLILLQIGELGILN